jgi:hypothetical protein
LDVSGGVVRVQRVYNGLANALVIADSTAAPIARWGVGILNAATGSESGGNDFAINAYSDSVVASTPLMITRSNGNVGIGGGAASSILDIRKAGATVRICDENRQPTIELVRGNGTAAFGTTTISDWRIQAANQFGHFQLVRANTTNTIMPFFINGSTGNIGIGHGAAQTFPLDVSGIIQTNAALYVCRIEDGVNNAIVQQASQTQAEFSSYKRSDTARNDILFRTINNAVSPVRMQILGENGYVGIGATAPAHTLDVNGTIRGSSNIVAVATSNWSVGTNTAFTDTTLSITYTPKQTGTVTVQVQGGADIQVGGGLGGDSAQASIAKGTTVISYWLQSFLDNNLVGRPNNMYFGGGFAITTISGATTFNMRFLRGGDDGNTYANAYLSIMELSTI